MESPLWIFSKIIDKFQLKIQRGGPHEVSDTLAWNTLAWNSLTWTFCRMTTLAWVQLWHNATLAWMPLWRGWYFDVMPLCHIKGNGTLWRGKTLAWCPFWRGTLWRGVHFGVRHFGVVSILPWGSMKNCRNVVGLLLSSRVVNRGPEPCKIPTRDKLFRASGFPNCWNCW